MSDVLHISRRQLLKTAGATAALGLSGLDGLLAADKSRLETIGIQLYTVRDRMAEDVAQTLKAIAALGYKEVEFAGYFDKSAAELRRILDGEGLRSPSAHIRLPELKKDLNAVFDFAAEIGHQYVVAPWLKANERSLDDYKRHIEFFHKAGETANARGLRFGYHNHDFEFDLVDGVRPYDLMLAEIDASVMKMTMDIYWFYKAGVDPLAYIDKHRGRFELCHVKDMTNEGIQTSVGAGDIDFAAIFAQSNTAGFRHYYVEQGRPVDSMASAAASIYHLKQLEFKG